MADSRGTTFPGHRKKKDDITNTGLFKHIENFTTKTWKFSDKNSDTVDSRYLEFQGTLWNTSRYP